MRLRLQTLLIALIASYVFGGVVNRVHAQVRLMGITGNQEEVNQVAYPAATVFEIDIATAEITEIAKLTWLPDSHAVGFNPDDGLIYHVAGSESWTDDPGRETGFRDHQYLESYNLATQKITPIFNANAPPSPDDLPAFGLPAPRPSWVVPEEQRLVDDPTPRERGVDEYHAVRHLTWSSAESTFYVADEYGIFTLTPSGQSTFIGPEPGVGLDFDYKALAFYTDPTGATKLLAGTKRTNDLYTLDPATGEPIDDSVILGVPEGSEYDLAFEGLLGMAQHPETGVLYGIRRNDNETLSAFERELITIDPETGDTQLIGNLGLHFTSLMFTSGGGLLGDFNGNQQLDLDDLNDLTAQSAGMQNPTPYDVNADDLVNELDVKHWIETLYGSWVGDADLNGEFNSGDLVVVLAAGAYETDADSVWASGDFNGSGSTNSGDLVFALAGGGYELGPRAAAVAVPEPSALVLLLAGLQLSVVRRRRRSKANRPQPHFP